MSEYVKPGGLVSNKSDLNMGVEELELSMHSYNCLKMAGISSVYQLCDMSAEEVRNIRHLRNKDYDEILGRLKDFGLSLKTDDYSCPKHELSYSEPEMTVQDEHMIEELIQQISGQPEDYWFKPGQVKAWIHCISIGKPLYRMKLVEIKNDLKDGYYRIDVSEQSDMFMRVREDFCAHYYLNDIDAEKIVILFAKEIKFYPWNVDNADKTDHGDVTEETDRPVMGKIQVGDERDYYSNPANEYVDIRREVIDSNEDIESTDLEEFNLSMSATCDFMRNGYITAGDYLKRGENSKDVKEESAVEFYNALVKCRYYGYFDIECAHPDEEYEGKKKCNILREIRRQIAADNDIPYFSEDCTFKGECPGTCPKCDEEIRYLQRKLDERQAAGLEAVLNRIDPKMLDGVINKKSIDSVDNNNETIEDGELPRGYDE